MSEKNEWKMVPAQATKVMQDAWDSAPSNEDADVEFHGAYRAMLDAAPNAPAVDGWLDIASAPKDGSRVLIWHPDYCAPITAQWYGSEGWKLDSDISPFWIQPTHWMDLPAAPGSIPSAPGDAQDDLTLAQKYEDACIVANANAQDAARWRAFERALRTRIAGPGHGTRIKVVTICPMYGDEKDVHDVRALIDAALAAQVPQQGEA
ncbi:hypothetical protein ACWGPO_22965 [Achromobacter animicus]